MFNPSIVERATEELRCLVATQCRSACETLFERFPEIRSDHETALEIIYYEYILRQEQENTEHATADEFCRRFPEFSEDLVKLFQVDEAFSSLQMGGASTDAFSHRDSRSSELGYSIDVVNHEPTIGQIGDYRLIQIVGRGGMGMVYRAVQEQLGRVVALKTISLVESLNAETISRFRKEAELASSLQHPNIAQIYEIGSQTKVPYFSMEYVGGGSLADVVQDRPLKHDLATRVVAVLARAMEYAHQQGILHRDLKLGNVLLSPSQRPEAIPLPTRNETQEIDLPTNPTFHEPPGNLLRFEPKIIDFGLAIQLGRRTDEPSTNRIFGTPSYMSPEQADASRGELAPTSDIFSLGAILYHLLVGRPPFNAATTSETLRQVLENEPVALRSLQPQIPVDLETICLKCLRKAPSDRYSSARDLADDLQYFLDGNPIRARRSSFRERIVKWSYRHPSAAGLVVASVIALVFITWLWRQSESTNRELIVANALAKESRERADANLDSAKAAVEQFLVKVTEDPRFSESDFTDFRKELLASALPFFEKLIGQKPGDRDVESSRAGAFARLASIQESIGQLEPALSNYHECSTILKRLSTEFPTDATYRFELVRCQGNLGLLLSQTGQREAAKLELRSALGYAQRLIEDFPNDSKFRNQLTFCHRSLANVLRSTGDKEGAKAENEKAIAVCEQLSNEFPNDRECRQYQADSHQSLAMLLNELEDRADAKSHQLICVSITKSLVEEYPAVVEYRARLANAYHNLGLILGDLRERKDAMVQYELSLSINEKLSKDFPSVTRYRKELARGHANLGNLALSLNDRTNAQKHFENANLIGEQLVKEFPSVPDYLAILGGGYCNLGNFWMMHHQANALELFSKSEVVLKKVLDTEPRDAKTRSYLRNAYGGKASVLNILGRYDEAADQWNLAAEFDEGRNKAYFQQQAANCRASAEQADLFDQVLDGRKQAPQSANENVAFAAHCRNKKMYLKSAELYRQAFQENAELAIKHRYNAACSIALFLADGEVGQPGMSPDQKKQWRSQILTWLQAEFESLSPSAPRYKSTLAHWLRDPDLQSVRDGSSMADLADEENQSLVSFWDKVRSALE
ncbi:MAG: serine/threonine-protein kinase [Pirellula sp.]